MDSAGHSLLVLVGQSPLLSDSCSLNTIISCVVVKIIIGVNLVSYATKRRANMEANEVADKVNDFGRDPIGEGKDERVSSRGHI